MSASLSLIAFNQYEDENCDKKIKKTYNKWPQSKINKDKFIFSINKLQDRSFIFEIKKRVLAKTNQPTFSTEDQNTVVAAS